MNIETQLLPYSHDDVLLEGFLAFDSETTKPAPGILIAHMWGGRVPFVDGIAQRLAELGYVAFAIDMYGKGVRGNSVQECSELMQPFLEDRDLLQERVSLAWKVLCEQSMVDADRTAAIGYCFGGMCVLDLARAGTATNGVVSFHGLLKPPSTPSDNKIASKMLLLHGSEDPLADMEDVAAIAKELDNQQADWQIHLFGGAAHAFTNPQAQDISRGTVYQKSADERSWRLMLEFLQEVL
ncbi:MAG: dienelactone hydrolase family protein [Spirochaetota bacterium]